MCNFFPFESEAVTETEYRTELRYSTVCVKTNLTYVAQSLVKIKIYHPLAAVLLT